MIKFKFVISSDSKVVNAKGTIKQNGFSSFKLVPVSGGKGFEDMFDKNFNDKINPIASELNNINSEANDIKNTVLSLSTNLTTNYLSKAELFNPSTIGRISSSIAESTATFVTTEQAGQWYGLELITDANGKKYITGFDIGALVNHGAGTSDSYFRINADRFIVGGDIGDGSFGGPVDENGEPIPAFSIVQDGTGNPQMYFNGKVNIASMPESITKLIGKFANISELNSYLAMHPEIVVMDGDSYFNTSENIMYFWDGDEWISAEGKLELRSFVFKRSKNKPAAPTGGSYSNPIPAGWNYGIPAPTFVSGADYSNTAVDPVWVSYALFDNKTDYTSSPVKWKDPEIMADTPNSDVMFHNSVTKPPDPTYSGDLLIVSATDSANGWYNIASENAMWTANRRKNAGKWTPWQVYKVKGEGSRGSSILHGSGSGSFSASVASSAFIAKFGNVINGDQYIWTSTDSGTVIRTYNGSSWVDNTALTVHGDAVINGTIYADKLATNALYGKRVQFDSTGALSSEIVDDSTWGRLTTAYSFTNTNRVVGLYSHKTNSGDGSAIYGLCSSSGQSGAAVVGNNLSSYYNSRGAEFRGYNGLLAKATNSLGVGVTGYSSSGKVGLLGHNLYGMYTGDSAYIGGTTYPFTGAHYSYTQAEDIIIGDIIEVIDSWVISINQSLVHSTPSNSTCSKKVFGICCEFNDSIGTIHESDEYSDRVLVDDVETWEIKEKFKPYFQHMVDNNFKLIGANALGEGGINVCEIGGDLEIGDYICSSDVKGKGMKQIDDLLHNYTVAKSLEVVIWSNEAVGENGCFEFEGVKCKMISCTYHCG